MATTKTLTGEQILTGPAFDAIGAYATTLRTILFSPFAASDVITNVLLNTKTSPVYDLWSTSAPFDPNAQQINLSFISNTGATLTTTHESSTPTRATLTLTSGDKSINFNGSLTTSGTNIDSTGNFINGTSTVVFNVGYSETKGTNTYLDDTTAYYKGTLTGTTTTYNSTPNIEYKWDGSESYWASGNYLSIAGTYVFNSTISGSGSSAVWSPHTNTSNLTSYAYWTTGFGLTFSGTEAINFDQKTISFNLNNVAVYDNALGSKTSASQATIFLTNISDRSLDLGSNQGDDIAGVQASVTKYLLPAIFNSGVIVTSINAQGSTLKGGDKIDTLTGGDGSDTLTGNGDNDTIDGGLGTNTAVYAGKLSDYIVTTTGHGTYSITDSVSGRDGTDSLTNIQYLKFSDVTKPIVEALSLNDGGALATPTVTAPANETLAPNQSVNVQSWFTGQPAKGGPSIDAWVLYESGSNLGPLNGHIHVANGYIYQNNVWSTFSGDAPVGTLVALSPADFAQATYSAPKVVGVHDDLYVCFVAGGQWSNVAHTMVYS